jgi:hypothetical protein
MPRAPFMPHPSFHTLSSLLNRPECCPLPRRKKRRIPQKVEGLWYMVSAPKYPRNLTPPRRNICNTKSQMSTLKAKPTAHKAVRMDHAAILVGANLAQAAVSFAATNPASPPPNACASARATCKIAASGADEPRVLIWSGPFFVQNSLQFRSYLAETILALYNLSEP